mgnify:FL=1
MRSLYPPWKDELTSLINRRNSSMFSNSDLTLTLDGSSGANRAKVIVTANEGTKWCGESFIVYARRDIAKAFLGIPVKIVLESVETTTIHAIIRAISDRYGFVFDPDVDFDAVTLATVIDFRDDISKKISIPIANTSMVWRGRLDLTVTNQHDVSPAHLYAGATTVIGDIITIYPG